MKSISTVTILLLLLCSGCMKSPSSSDATVADATVAHEIADLLYVADSSNPEDFADFKEGLRRINSNLSSGVVRCLVTNHWEDFRPSACEHVWAITPRASTVADCIYFRLEELADWGRFGENASRQSLKEYLAAREFQL